MGYNLGQSTDESAQELDDRYRANSTPFTAGRINGLENRVKVLEDAIKEHRAQKADDRCVEDDDKLYAALGDGIKCDRRVGDKIAMLHNCAKFIEKRCEGGGWYSYAELQKGLKDILDICSVSDSHECADISHIAMNLLNEKPDIRCGL